MKNKWYLNHWLIAILFLLWPLYGIPLIVGIVLAVLKTKDNKRTSSQYTQLESENQALQQKYIEIGGPEYETISGKIESIRKEHDEILADHQAKKLQLSLEIEKLETELQGAKLHNKQEMERIASELQTELDHREQTKAQMLKEISAEIDQEISKAISDKAFLETSVQELTAKSEKLTKTLSTNERKLDRIKKLYRIVEYSIQNYQTPDFDVNQVLLDAGLSAELEELSPTVTLKLHCMDVKSLNKQFRDNDKQITALLDRYASRYTTKANKAIYQLMVIALRAELQNILYSLKYEQLDKGIADVKAVTAKYLKIAGEGNQSIAGTLQKFIGEIEALFLNAVQIEYNYYVKREQARQEQAAIREQMRQEAAERKALEAERKKIENEEQKYNNEIEKVSAQLQTITDDSELQKLRDRIAALQSQLQEVSAKKEEIVNLQNGKAGTVYVISNLGSFGENVFKVGMTRRMEPMDRVKELGDASVPFQFDVHSFIFSEDAVGLERKMHQILDDRRVNKVNLRKEFFKVSLDEIEKIVYDIEPTASFNRTMAAEEFRQSISSEHNYTNSEVDTFEDEEDF